MKLSSKVFLLSADDTLHALASTAFMRRLRQEDMARVPDFAGQRVRQASVVVQVVDGTPLLADTKVNVLVLTEICGALVTVPVTATSSEAAPATLVMLPESLSEPGI